MGKLQGLTPATALRRGLPDALVTAGRAQWFGGLAARASRRFGIQ